MTSAKILVLCAAALMLAACAPAVNPTPTDFPTSPAPLIPTQASPATSQPSSTPSLFELTSPAFAPEGVIPDRYSCKGEDISPELTWGDPPAATRSLALIFDDPSGPWTHWVAYNLPPATRALPESVLAGENLPGGGSQGSNSWGALEYGGPCPPQGSTHRYVFALYALDTVLELKTGANKRELLAAMEGQILAKVELAASFTR
ncbi:MAG: YbhB/YbcL family Raf kinase inhibitor-like protein [Anaerolineales bacterium]